VAAVRTWSGGLSIATKTCCRWSWGINFGGTIHDMIGIENVIQSSTYVALGTKELKSCQCRLITQTYLLIHTNITILHAYIIT